MFPKIIYYLERAINMLNLLAGRLASLLLFLMMMLTVADVLGRTFWRPVLGTHELTYLWLALIVFLSLGYCQQLKEHLSVGVLIDKLPLKIQVIIDAVTYLIIFVILVLLSWQIYEYGQRSSSTLTADLNLPLYVFILFSAIGVMIFAITVLLDFLKSLQKVVKNDES